MCSGLPLVLMYNFRDSTEQRFEMMLLENSRVRVGFASWRGVAVILLAICALTISLATRFTVPGPEVQKFATVNSQSPDAKTQHLLGKAIPWTAPVAVFTLFQPPRPSIFAIPVVIPSTNLNFKSWLYTRPPPSC